MVQSSIPSDPNEIDRALKLLLGPDQVTELRVLGASTPSYRKPHTLSGYFDDKGLLTKSVMKGADQAKAFCVIPNPVIPDLLSRAANRVVDVNGSNVLTGDRDILKRLWLYLDFDPLRSAGISSTDLEHDTAIARAREVRDFLGREGWSDPLLADSGNGAHLLYRIDLPTDDKELVRKVLQALAFRFDDRSVNIDQALSNPSRIIKLYGTPGRKGDHTEERPHRLSRILEAPSPLEPIPKDALEEIARCLPKGSKGSSAKGTRSFDLDSHLPVEFRSQKRVCLRS